MTLADKLLGYLHSAFDKSLQTRVALRITYDGGMVWTVANGMLATVVTGGSGAPLSIDLSTVTLAQLAAYVTAQPGYGIAFQDAALAGFSALALLEGTADIATTDGDALYIPQSLTYILLRAYADELDTAADAIPQAIAQLAVTTAEGDWLDEIGSYYGVARNPSESDTDYGNRLLATVRQPKGNNIAIEESITAYLGGAYPSTVTDSPEASVTTWLRADGSVQADGTQQPQAVTRSYYGQFDVQMGFDLTSAQSITETLNLVRAAVEGFRDAGTRLRTISAVGALSDTALPPTDASLLWLMFVDQLDLRPAIRLQADGTILAGTTVPLLANGASRADGTLMASGYTIGGTPPTAGASVDPFACTLFCDTGDTAQTPLLASGIVSANGLVTASGFGVNGLDNAELLATTSQYANGAHQVGEGIWLADGTHAASGTYPAGADGLTAIGYSTTSMLLS